MAIHVPVVILILFRYMLQIGRAEMLRSLIAPFAIIFSWLAVGWVRLWVPMALWIAERVTKMYFIETRQWAPFISEYLNRFTGGRITVEQITKEGLGYGSRSAMEAMGDKFLTPMLGLIMPEPPLTMDKALGGANRFLATNLNFQMSAWLLHFIGDAVSLGKFKSLKDLPNAISWSYGIGWLSWLVMGTPFRKGIAEPLERLYNRIYTYLGFTVPQARDAVRHGIITYRDYLDTCLDLGYSPEKAEILYRIAERDFSDADMKDLVGLGWMNEAEVIDELVRRGYEPSRATILARLIWDDRRRSISKDIVREAGNLFEDRVLSEASYRGYLEQLGYIPGEASLQISLLKMRRSRRRFLTPAQLTSMQEARLLGVMEVRDYLINLGYTPGDADLYMKLREKG